MKKFILLSVYLGIFAGFWQTSFAQNRSDFEENGISTSKCIRVYVKLNEEGKWTSCDKEKDDGCRLRFCNSVSSVDEGGTEFWNKKQCNKYCVSFQEAIPIGDKEVRSISANSGTDLALNYVSMIYKFGASILGIFAVLVIVISGIQIIAGGISEEGISAAKGRILQALLSLALLFSSALILRTINPDFFA